MFFRKLNVVNTAGVVIGLLATLATLSGCGKQHLVKVNEPYMHNTYTGEVGNLIDKANEGENKIFDDTYRKAQSFYSQGNYNDAAGCYEFLLEQNLLHGSYSRTGTYENVQWCLSINIFLSSYGSLNSDPTGAKIGMRSAEDSCPPDGLESMRKIIRNKLGG